MRPATRSIPALAVLVLAGCSSNPVSTGGPSPAASAAAPSALATASPAVSAATSAPTSPTPSPSNGPIPAPSDPAAYVEGATYAPAIDPVDFVAVVDNP